MADMCDTCGDGVVELLRKILEQERDSFDRLAQINDSVAAGGATGASNITGINGVAPSAGCGVSTAGTLRVAQATDCNVQSIGALAHDVANTLANQPQVEGFEAIAHGTNPTAVAAGDVTKAYANRAGVPFVIGGHPNIITLRANSAVVQADIALVTVGAGSKIVVTAVAALVANSTTVDVSVRVGFGAATTPTTTGVVLTHPGIAPGSGYNRGDGSGILGIGADGEDLRVTNSVPTTGSIDILVSYYTIES